MQLTGRALVAAMCVGQLGNLLPHVTVPAITLRPAQIGGCIMKLALIVAGLLATTGVVSAACLFC